MILRLTVRRNNFIKLKIRNIYILTGTGINKHLLYILLLAPVCIYGATDNYPSGARASGLSNAGVVLNGLWSNYHNQAGLAYVEKPMIGFHYENKYVVDEYGLHALALAVPVNWGTIGVNAAFFGYSKYNETKIGLAYGKSFGERLSAGIQMDLLNVCQAEDYGSSATVTAEAGILAEPVDGLLVGAHVYNPVNASFNKTGITDVPVIFQAGIGYYFTEKLLIVAETEKDVDHKAVFQGGIEYNIIKNIFARIGLSSYEISSYSFGVGFVYKGINADMAFSHHQILGYTPHVSFSYSFR
jgi:hypothetical protein